MEVNKPGPGWANDWPGLMEWELDRLRERDKFVEIDQGELLRGVLQVRLRWPVGKDFVPIEAIFPDTYPFMRPQVLLRSPRDSWPERHINPIDGTICLLGRDGAQWSCGYHLAELLDRQLENALTGQGAEDPQAEPVDVWWNGLNKWPHSYCLIDSNWNIGDEPRGRLDFHYMVEQQPGSETPSMRGVVRRVLAEDGRVLASWDGPLPVELSQAKGRLSIPWARSETPILPREPVGNQIFDLRKTNFAGPGKAASIGPKLSVRPFAFLHPMEDLGGGPRLGWIVGMDWGNPRVFDGRPHIIPINFLPVLRGGASDLHHRVPDNAALHGKTVAVVGVGAIGAPIAIELARNGVASLRVIDHDIVEPGNSVRWPLGASSWGVPKTEALKAHLNVHYPGCEVVSVVHQLGNVSASDNDVLEQLLNCADLVVDASASGSVNHLLWHRCTTRGIPLVKVAATPTLGGGTVVRHVAGGGCPACLQWAREDDEGVPTPPGSDQNFVGLQPPGCGERTFAGGDYDLLELSLQTVRVCVRTLREAAPAAFVQTLTLRSEPAAEALPQWQEHALPAHPNCCAKPA